MLVVSTVIKWVGASGREVCAIVRVNNVGNVGISNTVVNRLMRQNDFVVIDLIGL